MTKYYKEKALLATENKIDSIKRDADFFKRNLNRFIVFGTLASFVAPNYGKDKPLYAELNVSYYDLVVFFVIVFASICFISYIIWKVQDRTRMRKLLKRKKELEEEIKSYEWFINSYWYYVLCHGVLRLNFKNKKTNFV